MREHKCLLGGEPSGHIIFAANTTTGDGPLAGLKVMECIKSYKKSMSQLVGPIKLFPQILKSTPVKEKKPLEEIKAIQTSLGKAQEKMGDKGRIVLRYSGTEAKIRLMVEGEDPSLVQHICEDLLEVIHSELG
jgi:phosphoglucosamine mutase